MDGTQLTTKLQFDNVIYAKEEKSGVIGDGPGTIKAWRVVALAAERRLGVLGGVGSVMPSCPLGISPFPCAPRCAAPGRWER